MSPHPDQHYIEAIRSGEPVTLRRLLAECYPSVEAWICQNGGTAADAQDVFGDALEAVCRKLRRGAAIELSVRFSTFIFSICRNQWLKRLRRKKLEAGVRSDDPAVLSMEEEDWLLKAEESELINFLRKKLAQLPESCRRLLEVCWADEKKSMSEIANMLGYGSTNYASKRKHECIEKLRKIILDDPDVEEYF